MKKIKSVILPLVLTFSAFLPFANVSAATNEITNLTAVNGGYSISVTGQVTGSMAAVAIEVLDGETRVAGPETTEVTGNSFSYEMVGTFDTTKVYTIHAADYNGGNWYTTQTEAIAAIEKIEIAVQAPVVGETVSMVDITETDPVTGQSYTYSSPDKGPSASTSSSEYEATGAWWMTTNDLDIAETFTGTFENGKKYYALIDIASADGHAINDSTKFIVNGVELAASNRIIWSNGTGANVIVELEAKAEEEAEEETKPATNPDTGIAPKASETRDTANRNISLGVAIATAASLTYGIYLFNKRKAEQK